MKLCAILAVLLSPSCAPMVAGMQGFANHPLGPGAQQQRTCVTNVQTSPYGQQTYATAYSTCR